MPTLLLNLYSGHPLLATTSPLKAPIIAAKRLPNKKQTRMIRSIARQLELPFCVLAGAVYRRRLAPNRFSRKIDQEEPDMTHAVLMSTYGRLPITFARGEGVWLYDDSGKRYMDAISGIGVNALGHSHPAVTAAITAQAGKLLHTSNLYNIERQQLLAEKLCAVSGMDDVFFCNSGAEANEAAIKLARLYGHKKDIEKPTIIVMDKAFHGRTLATLTASGNRKIQAGFEPLVSGFVRAPFGDAEAIRNIAANNPNIVAILVEPIQGEGGLHVPGDDYFKALREICDANDWLLMLDEVQTGNGRTGTYFAAQGFGIQADVITTAKGLGNGLPIGACLARGKAADVFQPGNHGSTFGGNPLVCAAGTAVVDTIVNEKLCDNAKRIGSLLRDVFTQRLGKLAGVNEIRGRGLMIGMELDRPCGELVKQAIAEGLLINVTAEKVVRLLPPLIMTQSEAQQLADTLCPLIENFLHTNA
jgi:acetylornithine aminotransferase